MKKQPIKNQVVLFLAIIATLLTLTGCGSKHAILGTWTDPSGSTTQFLKDGTFTSSGLIGTSGTYSFPDSKHIKFEYKGLLSIAGSMVYEYKVSGNTLTLTNNGITTELTKD